MHLLSRPMTCGIFLDQGSNLCLCVGRQIPNHHTTREGQELNFLIWIVQYSNNDVSTPSTGRGPLGAVLTRVSKTEACFQRESVGSVVHLATLSLLCSEEVTRA